MPADKETVRLCLVMEFCNGGTLRHLMKKVKFADKEILQWITQLCEGLDYLHSKNIVHRDIKPENVFLNLGMLLYFC